MYLCDSHTHSKYSLDGVSTPRDICNRAVEAGLSFVAVTDHLDFYTGMRVESLLDAGKLYRELETLKGEYADRLFVALGVEIGQPWIDPEAYGRFRAAYPLDFIIGSVHNFENDSDIYYMDFQRTDCMAIMHHYIDLLMELAAEHDLDVLGHITYPLRYMLRDGVVLSLQPFMQRFRELFGILTRCGKGIELNVSGFYKPGHLPMPDLELLKLYRECGGEILTIGSDGHEARYVGAPIPEGMELVKEAGFKYITDFRQRKPVFHAI